MSHATYSQVRGRKLYVLVPPQDYALVTASGKSADEGGSTREAQFDPLDAEQRAERMARGLRVYATVLQPGYAHQPFSPERLRLCIACHHVNFCAWPSSHIGISLPHHAHPVTPQRDHRVPRLVVALRGVAHAFHHSNVQLLGRKE